MSGDFIGRNEFESVTKANAEIVTTKFDAVVTQLVAMNENMSRMHGDMEKIVGQYAVQTNNLAVEVRELAASIRDNQVADNELDGRLQVIEKKIAAHEDEMARRERAVSDDIRTVKRTVLGGIILLLAGAVLNAFLS